MPVLLGGDVEKMSDTELAYAAEKATLFARLSPAHKQQAIRVLPRQDTRGRIHGRRNQRCGHRQGIGGSEARAS